MQRRGLVGVFVCLVVLICTKLVSSTVSVDSCNALLRALEESSENGIVVVGELECHSAEWPSVVYLDRDIVIIGENFGESRLSIPDNTILIVSAGEFLTFMDIILMVRTLDEGNTLTFIEVEPDAQVVVENTIIVAETCEGRESSNGNRSERDGDVNVLNAEGEEIVRSCNTAHVCSEDGRVNSNVIRSIEIAAQHSDCGQNTLSTPSSDDDDDPQESLLMITLLTTIVFAVLVIVLIAAVLFLIFIKYDGTKQKEEKSESSEEQSYEPPTEPKNLESNDRDLKKLESGERGELERQETEQRSLLTSDHLPLSNWNFKMSDIEIKEPLGRGSFGKVYKGLWQGTDVAIKSILHGGGIMESRTEPFEAYLSRQVSHPNVVQTFIVHTVPRSGSTPIRNITPGKCTTSELTNDESITSADEMFGSMAKGLGNEVECLETWIVLEYCDRGSLARAIHEGSLQLVHRGSSGPNLGLAILTALDIAHAMMYLHNVRIIHGDLKAANVLLKSDASDPRGFVCKVGDFGLSRFLADDTHIETFTCGTITHMPPELLKGGVLTPAADVYSFAILMWELLTGVSPYGSKTHGEIVVVVVNRQARPPIPEFCSEGYAELMEDCWRHSHHERPGFPEIVDRLKDLLEEEMANQLDTSEHQSTLVGPLYSVERSLASVEVPSFPSCQPMSCDYGWTLEPTDGSSRVLNFPEDLSLRSTPVSPSPEES